MHSRSAWLRWSTWAILFATCVVVYIGLFIIGGNGFVETPAVQQLQWRVLFPVLLACAAWGLFSRRNARDMTLFQHVGNLQAGAWQRFKIRALLVVVSLGACAFLSYGGIALLSLATHVFARQPEVRSYVVTEVRETGRQKYSRGYTGWALRLRDAQDAYVDVTLNKSTVRGRPRRGNTVCAHGRSWRFGSLLDYVEVAPATCGNAIRRITQ